LRSQVTLAIYFAIAVQIYRQCDRFQCLVTLTHEG
jgi:hypothetical protein